MAFVGDVYDEIKRLSDKLQQVALECRLRTELEPLNGGVTDLTTAILKIIGTDG